MSQIIFNAREVGAWPAAAAGNPAVPGPAEPKTGDDDDSVAGEEDPGAAEDLPPPPKPQQPGPPH